MARSASALESLVEHGLQSVVKIGAQPVLVGAWLAIGGGEEELRKKKKKKKAWPTRDLGSEVA